MLSYVLRRNPEIVFRGELDGSTAVLCRTPVNKDTKRLFYSRAFKRAIDLDGILAPGKYGV